MYILYTSYYTFLNELPEFYVQSLRRSFLHEQTAANSTDLWMPTENMVTTRLMLILSVQISHSKTLVIASKYFLCLLSCTSIDNFRHSHTSTTLNNKLVINVSCNVIKRIYFYCYIAIYVAI